MQFLKDGVQTVGGAVLAYICGTKCQSLLSLRLQMEARG